MTDYAHPETLVSTACVAEHLQDPRVRIVEVDVDTTAYDLEHAPGAVDWNWRTQLSDQIERDITPKENLERLLGRAGIDGRTMVVLYATD